MAQAARKKTEPAKTVSISTRLIPSSLGLDKALLTGGDLVVRSPIDGAVLGSIRQHNASDVAAAIQKSEKAFRQWRGVPAPLRGEFVRLLGDELRAAKEDLGRLVAIENGKILSEGLGEVQEMIDICDFAVGLSRQLYGLTIQSERPGHHMREVWQPIGPCGVITAFNFPVAVWAWNAALAFVCGNPVIWKPSDKTPIAALACQKILERAAAKFRKAGHEVPDHLNQIIICGRAVAVAMVDDKRVPLISATGSTAMGKAIGQKVAERFGRSLLELGGNNGMIVAPSADLGMAVRAILFSAAGTAGQRCTTLRRLIVHESVYNKLIPSLTKAYGAIRVGNPLEKGTLVGPLIDKAAFDAMQNALAQAKKQGGKILIGGERFTGKAFDGGYYVRPALVAMPSQSEIVHHETFAPILYILKYKDLGKAVELHNEVPQGLSSCIFTTDVREAETFLSATGSDCGIANVNIGPSGAEIGGAFGGERRPGAGAKAAPIHGSGICAGRPRRSTIRPRCRWRRASSSSSDTRL
jgi:aldehyde dehydrogenase (NAD+)